MRRLVSLAFLMAILTANICGCLYIFYLGSEDEDSSRPRLLHPERVDLKVVAHKGNSSQSSQLDVIEAENVPEFVAFNHTSTLPRGNTLFWL